MPFYLLLLMASTAQALTLTGKVIGVSDPETIIMADPTQGEHIVRLAGIVAPEQGHPLYKKAKKHLEKLVLGRNVTLEWERQEGNCDGRQMSDRCRKYGKVLMDVTDVNLDLIARGLAKHDQGWRELQSTPDRTQYTEAEEKARGDNLGLWYQKPKKAKKKKRPRQ